MTAKMNGNRDQVDRSGESQMKGGQASCSGRARAGWGRGGMLIALLTVILCHGSAHAAIVTYTNFSLWEQASGSSHETITFEEYPVGTFLTNQYSHLGATFVDGNDQITTASSTAFPLDGVGVHCGGWGPLPGIRINFDAPIHAFAIHYPAPSEFFLYRNGVQIHADTIVFGGGTAEFSGVVSSEPFDSIRIIDPSDNWLFVDNMYFTPSPGVLGMFAIAGLSFGSRRRRTP